jgi:hypothetical protein
MADELAKLTPVEVQGFYRRLANLVDTRKGTIKVSLAAMLMNHWLDNRDASSTFEFDAPDHLKSYDQIRQTLLFHRKVFLTEEKARFTGGASRWAGIIPRLQSKKWNGSTPLDLTYESLVEIPLMRQVTGDDIDRDILYGLHGFQLKSSVKVIASRSSNAGKLRITFTSFTAQIADRYDWDYSEHLTVPNPDHLSKAAGAVTPNSDRVVVYHRNAQRLEAAGLAAPYDLRSKAWLISDAAITAPTDIDPLKRLT